MVYIGRFAALVFGYIAAALAASAFLNVMALGILNLNADEFPIVAHSFVFSIPFLALFIGYFGFVPAVIAIGIAEVTGQRDWLFYAIAGSISAIAFIGAAWQTGHHGTMLDDPRFAMTLIGSGICGGIAYWLVAGRFAGEWRNRAERR
ncbi:hypothetical protein ABFT80_02095 [Mesorhizobium sp. SB112]|uniref:hypothetical protein n=1 Tax=Mesorhizobium sp. SB112 TaxID=3151853 RepID=UPI0032656087